MLFTKGAESAVLPFATSGEIEKTRIHVDEFALVSYGKFLVTIVTSIRKAVNNATPHSAQAMK